MIKNNILRTFNIFNTKDWYIRSFSRRQSRITQNQILSFEKYWSKIGITYTPNIVNINKLFKKNSPIVLEIGFGIGDTLVKLAEYYSNINFLGIEVYIPGIGSCLSIANDKNLKNLKIICYDAVSVLYNMIPNNTFNIIQIFFPDPWNKRKHHKRRIIKISFVNLLKKKLKIKGQLHIITDSSDYKAQIISIINKNLNFKKLHLKNSLLYNNYQRKLTKFEKKLLKNKNKISEILFKRIL